MTIDGDTSQVLTAVWLMVMVEFMNFKLFVKVISPIQDHSKFGGLSSRIDPRCSI